MPGYNLSWSAVFDPFAPWLWLAIFAWLIIGALSLTFCYKISSPFESATEISHQPTRSFFFMLQSLCQQGKPKPLEIIQKLLIPGYWQVPKSYACRIIFLLAYLMSAIIIPSYSGSLISSLTARTPYRPFDSLNEMLQYKDKYKLILAYNTAEYELFEVHHLISNCDFVNFLLQKSTDPLYQKVFEELLDKGIHKFHSQGDISQELCENNFAMFAVQSTTDARIGTSNECHIIKFSKPLSVVNQGLGFRKSSPYTGLVNFQ